MRITTQVTDPNTQVYLNKGYAAVESPDRINVQLYPHQLTLVQAILDVADKRIMKIPARGGDYDFRNHTNNEGLTETNAIVLSEKFGSGKSLVMIAVVIIRPIPIGYPQNINIQAQPRQSYRHKQQLTLNKVFSHEILRTFTDKDALIRPSLFVVGSSVLTQWEGNISRFTDLKCFVISDYYKLVQFYKLYKSREINAYDIVLLKNGKVTGNMSMFEMPSSEGKTSDYHSLINVVGEITRNHVWPWVFYDDFDTISIPAGTREINALMNVLVSATTKNNSYYVPRKDVTYNTLLDGFRDQHVSLASVTQDHVLFNKCNVCNEPDFTEQSTKVPIIEGFKYVYANPDDNYMRLLGVMGEDDANRIMEMCNAGAINTAAGDLGIETGSVADIFQKVLDTKYEKYMYDQEILEIIDKFRAKISALDPHPEGKKHTNGDLDSYRNAILKKNIPNVTFYSVELSHLADDMKADWTAAKEKDGAAISRVMDNIKEGMCQICCLPLEGIDTLIVRCCGLIVCDICSIKGNQLSVRWSHKLKATTLLGSCANCKADIDPRKDLIYLNQDFDIESILNARGDEVPDVPEPVVEEKIVPDEEKKVDPMDEIKNPKLKALLQICRGEIPDDRKSFEVNIPHLLQGRTNKPLDKDTPPKVLVFANYNETLNTIEEFLVEWKVPFLRLAGSSTQIAETVKKFHTYGTVLLINSQQHCAGLDLQHCSTDLVYYHKILDQNLESQVCGRIQRLGRKVNARIHYLLYKNEQVKM